MEGQKMFQIFLISNFILHMILLTATSAQAADLLLPNLGASDQLTIKIPDSSINIKAIKKNIRSEGGRVHWLGRIQDDQHGLVSLVEDNSGQINGEVFAGGKSYILQQQDGVLSVVESQALVGEPHGEDYILTTDLKTQDLDPLTAVTTTTEDKFVDVMIVYSQDVGAISGAEDTLRARLDAANEMLEKSCANFRYRLVHIQQITYTETGNSTTDLSELQDDDSGADTLDAVHALRTTYGADLVHLVTATSNPCGLAYLSQSGFYNDTYGFGVSGYWCNAKTLAHELGHNLGSSHDRYETGNGINEQTLLLTGYGFTDLANKYYSIMAYSNHCNDLNISCTGIQTFSNPKIRHNGIPFGIPNYVNAVQRMNEAAPYIANFRAKVTDYDPGISNSCVSDSNDKDVHCFIATAAYGSYLHKDVVKFRNFRDQVLKKNRWGQMFIDIYYRVSPKIAHYLQKSERVKSFVRLGLAALAWSMDYWQIIIGSLAFVGLLIGGRSLLPILVLLLSLIPSVSKSQVAFPSKFHQYSGLNPSLQQIAKTSSFLGIDVESREREIKNGSFYKELDKGDNRRLLLASRFNGDVTTLIKYNIGGKTESKITQTGFADQLQTVEQRDLLAQIGTTLWGMTSGFRYEQSSQFRKEDSKTTEEEKYGVGIQGMYGANFAYGVGGNYVIEQGDSIAKSQWIEAYLGAAVGVFAAENSYFFEVYLQRSPEVMNVEATQSNAHGQTVSTVIALEWASKTSFALMPSMYTRIDFATTTESQLAGFVPEDIKTTTQNIQLGAALGSTGFSLALGYKVRTIDSTFDNSDKIMNASLIWSTAGGAN